MWRSIVVVSAFLAALAVLDPAPFRVHGSVAQGWPAGPWTADIDADGGIEEWTIEREGADLVLVARDAAKTVLAGVFLADEPMPAPGLRDANGDGRADLVRVDPSRGCVIALDGRALVAALRREGSKRAQQYGEIWNSGSTLRNVWDSEIDDLDEDGEPEVIGQSYHYPGTLVHLFECAGDNSFERVWGADTLDTPSLNSLAAGETDGDGAREVIAGEVGTLGRVYLWEVVGDDALVRIPLNFDMNAYDGAIKDVRVWDGDGDGRQEIVVTTGDATEGGAVGIFEHSGAIGENVYSQVQVYETVSYMLGVSCGDSDNDGNEEYVLRVGGGAGTFPLNLRRLEYDPGSGLYQHKLVQPGPLGLPISSAVGDLDGDGENELVLGGAGPSGGFLYVLESPANDSYTLVWSNSFAIDGNVMDVALGLPNEFGYPTVVASSFGGQLEIIGFDGAGYVRHLDPPVLAGGAARSIRGAFADCPDLTADLVTAVSGIDQVKVYERQDVESAPAAVVEGVQWRVAPSPFTASTTIEPSGTFAAGPIVLCVAEVAGRVLRRWRLETPRAVTWDGRDAQGRAAPCGVYLLSVRSAGGTWSRPVLKLR